MCKNGHAFDEENTHMRPSGGRTCLACEPAKRARRYAAIKAARDGERRVID